MRAQPRGGHPAAAAILSVLLAFLLSACQSLPPPERGDARPDQRINVPFIAQEKYQCGPAALGMMLQWNDLPGDKNELVDEVWLPERDGSLGIELVAAGRARGLLPYPVSSPEALFRELQAGHPVLVMQNLALPAWPMWHFAVVTGYREGGDVMVLHSGTKEATGSRWNRFVRTWARAEYWGFVLLPPGELPDSVEPEPLLKALAPMEQAKLFHWRTARERFPDNGRIRFGYANALWEEDRRDQALAAFEETVELAPDLAPAWNNLAYARLDRGQPERAAEAVCRAAELKPDDDNIRDSVEEITRGQGCDR